MTASMGLTWNAATAGTYPIASYNIYRGGTKITNTGSTATSYTDTGLAYSTSYTYNVTAVDTHGNESAQSAAATATTIATGWPNATNTGFTGTLTANGNNNITTAGTYSNQSWTGTLTISASSGTVTLNNCLVDCSGSGSFNVQYGIHINGAANVSIQNTEIRGPGGNSTQSSNILGVYMDIDGLGTAQSIDIGYMNVHGWSAMWQIGGGTQAHINLHDSYGWGDAGYGGSHFDGFFCGGYLGNNLTINHCTINPCADTGGYNQTDCLMFQTLWNKINNVTINNCLMHGNVGFTVYFQDKGTGNGEPGNNITFTNNALGNGGYGYFYPDGNWGSYTYSNNYDYQTNAQIPHP
jgi:chitodextrinase